MELNFAAGIITAGRRRKPMSTVDGVGLGRGVDGGGSITRAHDDWRTSTAGSVSAGQDGGSG